MVVVLAASDERLTGGGVAGETSRLFPHGLSGCGGRWPVGEGDAAKVRRWIEKDGHVCRDQALPQRVCNWCYNGQKDALCTSDLDDDHLSQSSQRPLREPPRHLAQRRPRWWIGPEHHPPSRIDGSLPSPRDKGPPSCVNLTAGL